MTVTMSRWVLWIALLFFMPIPLFSNTLSWVPIARIAHLLVTGFGEAFFLLGLPIVLQALVWALVLGVIAFAYGYWSRRWPAKVRGSVMSLSMFSLLIIFASLPVYRPVLSPGLGDVTFMSLYE